MPKTTRLALTLFLLGFCWFAYWSHWAATRIRVPLAASVPLEDGVPRSFTFKTNVENGYEIRLKPASPSVNPVEFSWTLASKGAVLKRGKPKILNEPEWSIPAYRLDEGMYSLSVTAIGEGKGLPANAEITVIETAYYGNPWNGESHVDYAWHRALQTFAVLATAAFAAWFFPALSRKRLEEAEYLRVWCLTRPGPFSRDQDPEVDCPRAFRYHGRIVTVRKFKSIHSFLRECGVVAAIVFSLVVVSAFEVQTHHELFQGLMVRLSKPLQSCRNVEPLHVLVERQRVYVGSELVPVENLKQALLKEISLRPPDCPVYVEGNRDLEFREVTDVIDTIRGLRVEVIIPPASKKRR